VRRRVRLFLRLHRHGLERVEQWDRKSRHHLLSGRGADALAGRLGYTRPDALAGRLGYARPNREPGRDRVDARTDVGAERGWRDRCAWEQALGHWLL